MHKNTIKFFLNDHKNAAYHQWNNYCLEMYFSMHDLRQFEFGCHDICYEMAFKGLAIFHHRVCHGIIPSSQREGESCVIRSVHILFVGLNSWFIQKPWIWVKVWHYSENFWNWWLISKWVKTIWIKFCHFAGNDNDRSKVMSRSEFFNAIV